MSHIVTVRTQVRDPIALAAACVRLGIEQPTQGKAQPFSGEAEGSIIPLPGWHYPVVANVATGELKFDNFGGVWGQQSELDKLLQAYATEKVKAEARRVGHSVSEQTLSDGSIKLTIQVGNGGAL